MRQNISVSTKIARESYHHGDLANALTQAATDLAAAGGPEAVVLREAARQVGVSATAAYRYFESRVDLIHAVKVKALNDLADAMEQELARSTPLADPVPDAIRRLRALGAGYVAFALEWPGLFRTAFAPPTEEDDKHPGTAPAETRPYQMLVDTLDALTDAGYLAAAQRPLAEVAAWATVHGVAELVLNGPLRRLPPEAKQAAVDRALDLVVDGLQT
jgi:AcrR family transcriptional regulator